MSAASPLLKGTLDIIILKALAWEPRHGFEIARWLRTTSEELEFDDRALYIALHRLEGHGWITSQWGETSNKRKAKYYKLTAAGRKQLKSGADDWTRYAKGVSRILRAT